MCSVFLYSITIYIVNQISSDVRVERVQGGLCEVAADVI